jgi:hypothetical protein
MFNNKEDAYGVGPYRMTMSTLEGCGKKKEERRKKKEEG